MRKARLGEAEWSDWANEEDEDDDWDELWGSSKAGTYSFDPNFHFPLTHVIFILVRKCWL